MTPEEVMRCYRDAIELSTGYRPFRPSMRTPKDVEHAQRLLRWCEESMVDPKQVIDLRFAQMRMLGKKAPGFAQLASDTVVKRAQQAEVQQSESAKLDATVFEAAVRSLSVISDAQEAVRKRYALQGQHTLCFSNDLAGGYEPRSKYCPRCPTAGDCAQALSTKWGFDVPALRAGRLDLVPEVVLKALRGWNGSVPV